MKQINDKWKSHLDGPLTQQEIKDEEEYEQARANAIKQTQYEQGVLDYVAELEK